MATVGVKGIIILYRLLTSFLSCILGRSDGGLCPTQRKVRHFLVKMPQFGACWRPTCYCHYQGLQTANTHRWSGRDFHPGPYGYAIDC